MTPKQALEQKLFLPECIDSANRLLEELAEVIEELSQESGVDVTRERTNVETIKQQINREWFQVHVIGGCSTGKSTLNNSLLGRSHDGADKPPLPMGDLSTTAVPTSVRYGEARRVIAQDFDGKATEWSFDDLQQKGKINNEDRQASDEFLKNIREFEVIYPCDFTAAGVVLVDFPGTADTQALDNITDEGFIRADATIILYTSQTLGDMPTRELCRKAQESGLRVFRVVNVLHDHQLEKGDLTLKAAWYRLVHEELGGPAYTAQTLEDFAQFGIYFVHAKKALKARFSKENSDNLLKESGIDFLLDNLFCFLNRERLDVHIQHVRRFTQAGINQVSNLKQKIKQRQQSLSKDKQELATREKLIRSKKAELGERRNCVDLTVKDHKAYIKNASEKSQINDFIKGVEKRINTVSGQETHGSLNSDSQLLASQPEAKKTLDK